MINDYKDLIVWQKSMDLTCEIYKITKSLPSEERYCLVDQMRRAVISVPSNISEGYGRSSRNEFSRFLSIAHGSLRELETQIIICQRLNYLDNQITLNILSKISEVGRLLGGLKSKLNK